MHGDLIASTNLLKNLKNGLAGVAKKTLPESTYGSPINQPPPPHCQEWMKSDSAPVDGSNSEEIHVHVFSSNDETEEHGTN